MRAAELQDVTVEGLGLLPVDRVSGLGQHDELGSVSGVRLLRLDFLRPFPSQSECKIDSAEKVFFRKSEKNISHTDALYRTIGPWLIIFFIPNFRE